MKKITLSLILLSVSLLATSSVFAQNTQTLTSPSASEDPTQSSFRIVACDGPELPANLDTKTREILSPSGETAFMKKFGHAQPYVPCNFNGMMIQVQHLINIAMVLGVLAAIVLFTYAGYLLMTGKDSDRSHAKDIFPKIFIGLIIMLSAWFIVYQILNWLTGNGAFTKLLGSP
ncbi:MAG: pilin [Patescibacteria group bacterium]